MTAPTEDWRQERARVLAQARVVVVKVGSAVLTDAQGLSMPVLENLAGQLARLRNLLPAGDVASSNAGGRGAAPSGACFFRRCGRWAGRACHARACG